MINSDLDVEKQQPPPIPAVDTKANNRGSLGDELTAVESHSSHTPGSSNSANGSRSRHEANPADAPGEPNPSEKTEQDAFLVKWDGPEDPENPKNWSVAYRWYITAVSGLLVLNATFASSAPAGVLQPLIERFHLSHILAVLTISLFIAGYCVGPLLWGPLTEQYGRKAILLFTFFVYTCFQVGGALARNTASVLVFRFLGGMFAASPLAASGAIIGDIWNADVRGQAMSIFALAPFAGPALGPIVGGYIAVSGASWRWLFWVLALFSGFCFLIILLTVPETYAPVILKKKAQRKRKETQDARWCAELEARKTPLKQRIENVLGRPFRMLATEPMLMALTLYLGFLYGCVYLCFEAYPVVFTVGHHLNAGQSGLTFLPLFSGGIAGCFFYIFYFNPSYERLMRKHAPKPVPPEVRLIPSFYGGPLLVISFLWLGWTSYPSISIWAPLMSGVVLGIAVLFIFLSLLNYIIDAYLIFAASALAANTVIRSLFGAIFPLFSTQMYERLNPRWASTLLAGIALLLLPIPFVLYRYGTWIRRTSKYAPTDN